MNTIADKWADFRGRFPADAPDEIMATLKQVFYSGAFAYMELENTIDSDSEISGDASVAIMQGVEEELLTFLAIEVVRA